MKKIVALLPMLVVCTFLRAQKVSMHSNGYVSTFEKVDTLFLTEYAGTSSSAKTAGAMPDESGNLLSFGRSFGFVSKSLTAARTADSRFATAKKKFTTAFYAYSDGTLQAPTSTLFFKPATGISVDSDFNRYGVVEPHNAFKGYFNLHLNTDIYHDGDQVILLCDSLYKAGLVSIIEPVFVRHAKLDVEPLEPLQWNLNNTGQNGWTAGADMKVSNVWPLGFTGTNIKVAVIDIGVQLTHPDLQANLLPGFDATGGGSAGGAANNSDNTHGTACSGIIAALRNNIGVVGIAPNARIIPIRLAIAQAGGLFNSTDQQLVDCYTFAYNNGADIVSNSYSLGSPSAQIDQAIQNIVTNGRSGRGTLVFYATGNNNSSTVKYPATNPNVIAVGASSPCDQRKSPSSCDGENWGGNYGLYQDIVAPGARIATTTFGFSDYTETFNGTSAACPNAAGVAALILSAKPTTTGAEARRALESTCDKIGGYSYQSNASGQPNGTWSLETGYGRVNAFNAVTANNLAISGLATLCGQATYSIQNLPANASVQWSSSTSTGVTLTPQGNNVLVQGNSSGSFTLIARVSFNGTAYTISRSIVFASYSGPSNISLDPSTQDCLTFGSTRTFYAKDDNGLVCNNASVAEIEWQVRDYSTSPRTVVTNYTRQNCAGILNTSIGIFLHSNSSPYILEIVCRAKDKCGTWGPWGPGNGYLIRSSCTGLLKAFTLAPNPATSNVMLTFSDDFEVAGKMSAVNAGKGNTISDKNAGTPSEDYTIEVWNSMGRLMKTLPGRGKNVSIPLSGLTKGIYYVNVVRDGVRYKETLWVQ